MLKGNLKFAVLIFVIVLIVSLLPVSYLFAADAPSVKTDKAEYSAEKEIKISGKDFNTENSYNIVITDRAGSEKKDKINLKKDGKFEYKYNSNGMGGDYRVKVLESASGALIAETSFFEKYPTIITKKEQYSTGKEVKIEGENFLPETGFVLEITTKNGVLVNEAITTKKDGKFNYKIKLSGICGEYVVKLYNSINEEVVETSFFEEELSIVSDKADYAPGSGVKISGRNFVPNESFTIVIICPYGEIWTGDGTFTPGSDVIKTNKEGEFEYKYRLYEVSDSFNPEGLYIVRLLNPAGNVTVEMTFTDATVRW